MFNVAICVDVENMYYSIKKKFPDRKLDYSKYLTKVLGKDDFAYFVRAYDRPLENDNIDFVNCLKRIGYDVKQKYHRKMHCDLAIAIDIISALPRLDRVVIGSNKLELLPLVDYLTARNCTVDVVACDVPYQMQTPDPIIIDESFLEDLDEAPAPTE